MAIADKAQQKALWPYGTLEHLKTPDGKIHQMLQQDKEKFLASILVPQVEPLRIPLISPMADSDAEKIENKKVKKNKPIKKSKNAFVRSFKKFLYFKPKTFWGTQILVPILSTVIGIWVTAIVKEPKIDRPHYHRPPVAQQAVTNAVPATQATVTTNTSTLARISAEQMTQSFNLFYQLYQNSILKQSGIYTEQTMTCPTCKHSIQVDTSDLYPVAVKCLKCNQAFQSLTKQEEGMVRN